MDNFKVGKMSGAFSEGCLVEAIAFVNPSAVVAPDARTVTIDGNSPNVVGTYNSPPFTWGDDMDAVAEAIQFANPAAIVTFDHDCIKVVCLATGC